MTFTCTAKQIADALGVTPQAMRQQLRGVPASAVQRVSGNEAAAWTLAALPPELLARLAAEAGRQHCRSVETLLAMPRRHYQPAIPLDKICAPDIEAATRLREALRPWLVRQHDPNLSAAEMETHGGADYQRIFGNSVTPRYWRELFTRTVDRDNGAEQWNRLKIYLPEKVKPKAAPAALVLEVLADDFAELENYLAACGNPHAPSKTECAGVWALALDKFSSLVRAGTPDKAAARRVRQFLFARASFLAASRDALWLAFKRKLEALQMAGGDVKALRDGRAGNGEHFELPENDRDLVIHRAVFYYRGDIAPAWRDLLRGKLLSAETIERYAGKAFSKSHVPTTVRESVAPEVEILTVMHQGRRAFDAIKGHVTRNYDGIASMQCISGDDFTLNTYFYVPDGNGWYNLTRGQVILFIDLRTLRILGWALEPRKSYSSLTIRALCTHIFGAYGVPKVLYFERGLWRSATLLKGKTDPFTFAEISQGLREFGIEFKHAIRPRAKVVERIGGMFQDIAEAEPGYYGRDERRDAPESLRVQMALVDAKRKDRVHPSKYFYSLDQWNQRLEQLVTQYNAEPQQGDILAGLSPDQAFEKFMDHANAPVAFAASLRYLLANDKRLVRVTVNGITIQIGKQKFNYKGKEIAHLVNREALAWFDPENPETITVTDMDRMNPICVARSESPNALESIMEPESGTLGRELARVEHQASYMKTRFNVVKAKFPLPARMLLNASQAIELGEEMTAQKTEIAETQKRQRRNRNQAHQLAQRTGIYQPEQSRGSVAAKDLTELSEFLKGDGDDEPQSKSLRQENGGFIYHLKPTNGGKANQ